MNTFPRWLKLVFIFFPLTLLISGTWFFWAQQRSVRKQVESDLETITQFKVGQIKEWRAERLSDAAVLAKNRLFIEAVARWMSSPNASGADRVREYLGVLRTSASYSDVLLVTPDGQLRFSLGGGTREGEIRAVKDALREGRPVFVDLHDDEGAAPHTDVIAPLILGTGAGGRPVGAVILRSDAWQFLYPLIASWPTASKTAETLLVRRDGDSVLWLNNLRYRGGAALRLRVPLTQTETPAVMAVLGKEGVFDGKDYRGVEVLSVLKRVPDSPWFMVAKVDKVEALAAWRTRSALILALLVGFGLSFVAIIMVVWQRNLKGQYRTLFLTEKARRIAEEKHRVTLLSVGDAVIVTDADSRIELLNPVAALLTGWSQEEALGKPLHEVFHIINEDTRQEAVSPLDRVIREGIVLGLANHTCLVNREGKEIPIEDSAAPILGDSGKAEGAVLVFHDVSTKRQAERALQQAANRLRTAERIAGLGNFSWDPVSDTTTWSEGLYRITGRDPNLPAPNQEERGRLYTPESWARLEPAMNRALTTGKAWDLDVELVRADGRSMWANSKGAAAVDASGRIVRLEGTFQDISERKQVHQALEESEERLRTILELAPDGIFVIDELGHLIEANRAACQQLGYTRDQLLRRTIFDFIAPRFAARVAARLAGDVPSGSYPTAHLRADGVELPVELSVAGIMFGGRRAFVGVARDVSERTRTEAERGKLQEQLAQAQKMESIGRLAGGVAHDFNNLLTIIRSFTEMLQYKLPGNDSLQRYVQQILNATDRASGLTGQLLAFSRKQMIAPVVLDLNVVVNDTAKMLGRLIGEDIELDILVDDLLPAIEADPDQVTQILINLSVNARDAMPQGGRLTIATRRVTVEEASPERAHEVEPGEYVSLSVTDTGIGMSRDLREQIFEPFFTTKEHGKGTGLGLSTVYGIVKQSGGYIWVDSEVGSGSCFTILFPKGAQPAARVSPAESDPEQAGRGTILVVEDEQALREGICEFLAGQGYKVLSADSGQMALAIVEEYQGHIDVLLTDVVMPKMSGRELAETLQATYPDLKIVFMSGYTEDAIIRHGIQQAGPAFLQKPFKLHAVARKLRDVLGATGAN